MNIHNIGQTWKVSKTCDVFMTDVFLSKMDPFGTDF